MTATLPIPEDDLGAMPIKRYDSRWRLHRGGIVNVWFYYDEQFTCSGGRIIWRGTNGAGKSRALEMLLPFLLDADRRNIDVTGAKKVRLEDLMSHGAGEQTNRAGYVWLELEGEADGGGREHLTLGAFLRFSKATAEAKVWYFTTPLRVGHDLPLLGDDREPLSREGLTELVGADRITDKAETHRERVRAQVFGLTGESARERYAGLLQLLHVLRNPNVGNRIEAGQLPELISDALPPLSEAALANAGQQLDGLSETRATQHALEQDEKHIAGFLDTYRRYGAGVLLGAGEGARQAAEVARSAAAHARREADTHTRLRDEHAAATAVAGDLTDRRDELDGAVNGIRGSQAYRDAAALDDVERRVLAQQDTAAARLRSATSARDHETTLVGAADARAEEAVAAAGHAATALEEAHTGLRAAGMAGDVLPAVTAASIDDGPPQTEAVRTEPDTDPAPTDRPIPRRLTVTPADPRAAADAARRVQQAADRRAAQAGDRLDTARRLRADLGRVERADDTAEEAALAAEASAAEADTAADLRDSTATALAEAWRHWTADPTTAGLLGDVAWDTTAVGPLLADLAALTGDDPVDAAELDRAAGAAAGPAQQRLADSRADLRHRQDDADRLRADLEEQAEELRRERDPEPASPPWQTATPPDAVPLWRAMDFADAALPDDRKGALEGALHAAGLLTATLTHDGAVTATDGQVLLTTAGPVAARPLSALLVADPSSSADPATVTAVLARIGTGEDGHPVWIADDGSWGNGPLRGRHPAPAARHIGAAARAAHRAARLAEIAVALDDLTADDEARAAERAALDERGEALDAHLRTAPPSDALTRARADAAAADARATRDEQAAETARARARQLRTAWTAAHDQHVEACRAFGLATDADALAAVRADAASAGRACTRLAGRLVELAAATDRHAAALAAAASATGRRRSAEADADDAWGTWRAGHAEVEALRASVGAEAATIRDRLSAAEAELKEVRAALRDADQAADELGRAVSAAQANAGHAEQAAAAARSDMAAAVARLRAITALRGLATAAVAVGRTLPELPAADPVATTPADVDAAVRALEAAVDNSGSPVDSTAVLRAQQNLERDLQGTFDVFATDTGGVWLFDLVDASGTHTVASGHDLLRRRTAEGRKALSERERTVFTEFVLGGVAAELQQHLGLASQLIDAMNASLDTIRTSHGIGVRITWNLAVEPDSPLARIRDLVTLAGEVRTPEQDAELIELITARVEEYIALDPTAGYATHLKAALDYRDWHEVVPLILGPEPGQRRTISRRSKLSEGETRFVSYVTLFAAVDAYLSGLPDTTRALRLIVLDDAFAKVDNRTIGVLMGLLVRLDIDFAMTGHGLWGTYPQVPALDIYEVRRREGRPAVTTHVFWDGRVRHLRPAG